MADNKKSDNNVEIWKRVATAGNFVREGEWLQIDLEGGERLRIRQPGSGPNIGGKLPEGPVTFENFRYEDEMPPDPPAMPGLPIPNEIPTQYATEVTGPPENPVPDWQPFTHALMGQKQNVIGAQVKIGGQWRPTYTAAYPGMYIRRVTWDGAGDPQQTWEPGLPGT